MTIAWRPLAPGETDHELLWLGVAGLAALTAALAWWGNTVLPVLPCPFRAITGIPCPTCGATRATLALVALDIRQAFRWNPAVPVFAGVAAAYLAYAAGAFLAGNRRLRITIRPRAARLLRAGALVCLAVLWTWLIVDGR